jgi:cell wall assembly regulator SMI1
MSASLDELLADFLGAEGTDESTLDLVEQTLKKTLPKDYRNFLLTFNGGEVEFGTHRIALWKAEELEQFNREHQVDEYAPGLLLFGSNGGGEGFAFDTRSSKYPVVQVPFIGMDFDSALVVADSFTHLLNRMLETDGSLF